MARFLYHTYLLYQVLVIAGCVYLATVYGFGIEYVLLGVQSLFVLVYSLKKSSSRYKNEFSLFIVMLFVGIVFYALLHLLVVVMSTIVISGWFFLLPKIEENQAPPDSE